MQLTARGAKLPAHQSRSDEAVVTLLGHLPISRQALADAIVRGEAGRRHDTDCLSKNRRALKMEFLTTASDAARLRKEVDRLNALVGRMTNARGTGSNHIPCSHAFVAMCEKAQKMGAELKRIQSQSPHSRRNCFRRAAPQTLPSTVAPDHSGGSDRADRRGHRPHFGGCSGQLQYRASRCGS